MIKKLFLDDVTKENTKKRNPNWSQISDHTYRILTIGDSESWKRNSLFSPICQCGGGAEGVGGATCAHSAFVCLLWEHQGSKEREILREFLKFIKVFLLNFFFQKFCI